MKNIIKDACILFAITLVAGILLGLVYNVTKDPIAQQNEKAKQKAYQEVIADADKFEALDGSYASDKVAETAKAVLSASATDFSKDDEPVPSVTTLYSEVLVPLNCAKNEGSCLALIPRPAVSLIVRIDVPRYVPSVESPTENLISPP